MKCTDTTSGRAGGRLGSGLRVIGEITEDLLIDGSGLKD